MTNVVELLETADSLAAQGNSREAIDLLTDANRIEPTSEVAARLVGLRHAAWSEVERPTPPPWAADLPDDFPDETGVPEIAASDLTGTRIRSALQHHGGLVVRGLVDEETCADLRTSIDRSWAAIEHYLATKELDTDWFQPLEFPGTDLTIPGRAWVLNSGTSYVPDSPRLLFELLEALRVTDFRSVVADYFGEPPALSLVKLAHRRLPPDAKGGWHQDGAVYGLDARTLNLWLPVSRCGDVAPGLDMWPRRLDGLVETMSETGTGAFSATAGAVAELTDEVPSARPIFEPGDAALFDQFLLHQTGADDGFTENRYGFECWFFAPSTYPDPERWIPLAY